MSLPYSEGAKRPCLPHRTPQGIELAVFFDNAVSPRFTHTVAAARSCSEPRGRSRLPKAWRNNWPAWNEKPFEERSTCTKLGCNLRNSAMRGAQALCKAHLCSDRLLQDVSRAMASSTQITPRSPRCAPLKSYVVVNGLRASQSVNNTLACAIVANTFEFGFTCQIEQAP